MISYFEIYHYPCVDSTNQTLRDLEKRQAHSGTVVIADEQMAGRGSHKRRWVSPKGGLYFSVLLKGRSNRPVTDLSLLGAVVLSRVIRQLVPHRDQGIKWPNDYLIEAKKVAGVLAESTGQADHVILGIGINLWLDLEIKQTIPSAAFAAGSLGEFVDAPFNVNQVMQSALNALFEVYEKYLNVGFEAIREEWHEAFWFQGKKIRYVDSSCQSAVLEGIAEGIDAWGRLMLRDQSGKEHAIVAGDVECYW